MLKWLIIVSAIIVVAAGGFWFLGSGGGDEPQYQTVTVGRGGLTQAVTATGTLNPVVNVTVGSQVSGRIIKLNADFNSPVTKGEIIAEIDPANYQARLSRSPQTSRTRARTWNCSRRSSPAAASYTRTN